MLEETIREKTFHPLLSCLTLRSASHKMHFYNSAFPQTRHPPTHNTQTDRQTIRHHSPHIYSVPEAIIDSTRLFRRHKLFNIYV